MCRFFSFLICFLSPSGKLRVGALMSSIITVLIISPSNSNDLHFSTFQGCAVWASDTPAFDTFWSIWMDHVNKDKRAISAFLYLQSILWNNFPAPAIISLTAKVDQTTQNAQKSVCSVVSQKLSQPVFSLNVIQPFCGAHYSAGVLVYNFLNDGVTIAKWAGSNLYPDTILYPWQGLLFHPETCSVKMKNSTTIGGLSKWRQVKL